MNPNIDEIVNAWDVDERKFRSLGKSLISIVKDLVYEKELYPEITYRVKDLLSIIRKIKKKQLLKSYGYNNLSDKLGVRIICSFTDEMEILDGIIKNNFIVIKEEKKQDSLDYNRLDYISNHYDLMIDASKKRFKKLANYKDLFFELQVKTLNQHTWSITSHALSYKQEAKLSDAFKRKIFRLLSLYEIADDEFLIVNNALKENSENIIYSLLRKTEGKIYKFAKVDFDREYSLYALGKLVTYFSGEELVEISKEVDAFIKQHERKIRKIFEENAKRFHKVPFLAQPEIFVIWFALERFPFAITDHWENDFEANELEQIQTLWGKDI